MVNKNPDPKARAREEYLLALESFHKTMAAVTADVLHKARLSQPHPDAVYVEVKPSIIASTAQQSQVQLVGIKVPLDPCIALLELRRKAGLSVQTSDGAVPDPKTNGGHDAE